MNDNAIVNLNMLQCQRPAETYYSIIDSYIKLFGQLIERKSSERSTSSNTVPQTLYLKYEALSKFQLFKWIYQHESTYAGRHYEDLEITEKLIDKQKEFVNLSQLFQSTNYIWDKEIFIRLVNEVKFFLNINLISEDSVKRIKKELLLSLIHIYISVHHVECCGECCHISHTHRKISIATTSYHLSGIECFACGISKCIVCY